MKKTTTTKISKLPIFSLAIAFSLSTLLIVSCGGSNNNDKPAETKIDSSKASFKIIGTWINPDNPIQKAVFTADSVSQVESGHMPETFKYNWVTEQEIEITNSNTGKKEKAKVALDGDKLTISVDGNEVKLIREGANVTTAPEPIIKNEPIGMDTTTTEQAPLTPEEKAFKNTLTGTWSNDNEKVIFTNDEIKFFNPASTTPSLTWKYTIVDEKSVEITDDYGKKSTATMTFEDNKTTLKWVDKMGSFTYKWVSDNQ